MDTGSLVRLSETHQVKLVFKNTTNDYNTLFGGVALHWMDEVAYITATRFCRKKVVTVSSDGIRFHKVIPYGSIVELVGRVENIGAVKLKVRVEVFIEHKYSTQRDKAVEGLFCFTAVGKDGKPVRLPV